MFSNTVAPSIVGASIAVLDMLTETTELRDKLEYNTKYFRSKMTEAGFDIKPGDHPIVPIMLYDAVLAQEMAAKLFGRRYLCNWLLLSCCCKRTGTYTCAIKCSA